MSWEIAERFRVKLGSNFYINVGTLVQWRSTELFKLYRRESDGQLGIDCEVIDRNGKTVAVVRNNKVVAKDASDYELVADANSHLLRERSTGRAILQVKRAANGAELEVNIDTFLPDGSRFVATPQLTVVGNMMMMGCTVEDCAVGVGFG